MSHLNIWSSFLVPMRFRVVNTVSCAPQISMPLLCIGFIECNPTLSSTVSAESSHTIHDEMKYNFLKKQEEDEDVGRTLVRIMHTLSCATMDHSKRITNSEKYRRNRATAEGEKVERKYHIGQTETDISGAVSWFINQLF